MTNHNPIVITKGGIYMDSWSSNDPTIPAVTVQTTEPVILKNSSFQSRFHCVKTAALSVDLTLTGCTGVGLNPYVLGQYPGRFVSAGKIRNLVITDCTLSSTSGISVTDYVGKRDGKETIKVNWNRALNIDGRKSNGFDGFAIFNVRTDKQTGVKEEGFYRVQFLQVNRVTEVPGIEVMWNSVINEPEKSRVEDNINFYYSSGVAASPIRVANNLINGAWSIRPTQESYEDEKYVYENGYSGGGIISDGGGEIPPGCKRSASILMLRNTVLNTTNYGVSVAHGNNVMIQENRVLSAGFIGGQYVVAQNIGISVGDLTKVPDDTYFNNVATGNAVSVVRKDQTGKLSRADLWLKSDPRNKLGLDQSINNVSILPDKKDTNITQAHVDTEVANWNTRAKDKRAPSII